MKANCVARTVVVKVLEREHPTTQPWETGRERGGSAAKAKPQRTPTQSMPVNRILRVAQNVGREALGWPLPVEMLTPRLSGRRVG
jgi:hypothetical protein